MGRGGGGGYRPRAAKRGAVEADVRVRRSLLASTPLVLVCFAATCFPQTITRQNCASLGVPDYFKVVKKAMDLTQMKVMEKHTS